MERLYKIKGSTIRETTAKSHTFKKSISCLSSGLLAAFYTSLHRKLFIRADKQSFRTSFFGKEWQNTSKVIIMCDSLVIFCLSIPKVLDNRD